ncbi:MAG: hypothetical protein HWN79_10260 [Candidatus Lokiarchaeota archaeon]|nr:hypothetical protein [Candidatus Lokiarchaeota archaeon]
MKDIKWKLFKKTFPLICTNCDNFSNMERDYCESCGAKDSFRAITKADHSRYQNK